MAKFPSSRCSHDALDNLDGDALNSHIKQMRNIMSIGQSGLVIGLMLALSSFPATAQETDSETAIGLSGDPEHGRRVFLRCQSCHPVSSTAPPRLGPNLYGLFGRVVGAAKNYTRYSKALSDADFVWSAPLLDQWLTNPRTFLPGNKMIFAGLQSAQDRADLIAFLRGATSESGD